MYVRLTQIFQHAISLLIEYFPGRFLSTRNRSNFFSKTDQVYQKTQPFVKEEMVDIILFLLWKKTGQRICSQGGLEHTLD